MNANNRIHAIDAIAARIPAAPAASLPPDTSLETYGEDVFGEREIRASLPRATADKLLATINDGKALDPSIADDVAHAMKDWALAKGATHFTHWFQPLTGGTAEKHDAFLEPAGPAQAVQRFSGKNLIGGETDASSFPSGGLRSTFEARGYTAWDPTSPAFIKDDVLCIPTAFISYNGESLDKKTPLLRSMTAVSDQAKRVMALFGKHPDRVVSTVGPEQEYFLIKEEDFAKRPDLILCGRTLFGAAPDKGQELQEHYFGSIRPTVSRFMKELDTELWKLAVPAKTKHNEVAPCQHELAPVFEEANVAIDHNLLVMELMKIIASHHGLVCLEHEKPFEGINGSGKHDNWSLSADGQNLLDPGDTPEQNLQFLVFLTCVIAAVDDYQEMLRVSVASAGNDHRLGANEAPPAIISIFLGDQLNGIVEAIIEGKTYESHDKESMYLGVPVLPNLTKDATDRNRTSPFAFTGNKFEFRAAGSRQNLSDPNMVLNTAVAKELKEFANAMESSASFETDAMAWIKQTLTDHQHIIFNGDGYSAEWTEEAAKRGLSNLRTLPDAAPAMMKEKNIALLEEFGVMSRVETKSHYEIKLEQYANLINIEALTMIDMANKQILPAVNAYAADVASNLAIKQDMGVACKAETKLLKKLSDGADAISDDIDALVEAHDAMIATADVQARGDACRDSVLPAMEQLRKDADA
ncbi:MAG: glutamine synthetase III, partial [Coriobacteriaceae bacterium]|nr:glutamine synthetase III [Coriobacteriaceae bacterium]